MRNHFLLPFLLLALLFGSCSSQGHSKLEKALSSAVADEKLSPRDQDAILEEYSALRDENKKKASEYAEQIVTAIELGADSSHIDVVRRQFVKKNLPPKITV